MKNSNDQATQKLEKCPYQVLAYGENNCDVVYRTSYRGDWGHWDEPVENIPCDVEDPEMNFNPFAKHSFQKQKIIF